jgi:hypothetical protein
VLPLTYFSLLFLYQISEKYILVSPDLRTYVEWTKSAVGSIRVQQRTEKYSKVEYHKSNVATYRCVLYIHVPYYIYVDNIPCLLLFIQLHLYVQYLQQVTGNLLKGQCHGILFTFGFCQTAPSGPNSGV